MRRAPAAAAAAAALLPLLLGLGTGVRAETSTPTPIPPAPAQWVTDRAAFLSPSAAAELDARLGDYARRTGHQVLVYIDHSTGGLPIEDWGVRAFEHWRVGRRGIDDGLVMLVFADDHRVRLEVGHGLEGRVPDAVAKRIIEERILPRIRSGDRDGAIRVGVDAVTAAIGAPATGTDSDAGSGAREQAPVSIPLWKLIAGALVMVFMVGFVITHPSLAWLMLLSIGSGRGGGGGGGGGSGGFSGGGGRSGGGGASGSW